MAKFFLVTQLGEIGIGVGTLWRESRSFRAGLSIIALGTSFAAGFYSHIEFEAISNLSVWQRVAVVGTVTLTLVTGLIVLITTFFKLELLSRDLELKSLNLQADDKARGQVATKVARDLVSRVNRAIDAQGALPGSVFSERSTHYEEEKRFLAERFIKKLLPQRIRHLRSEMQPVEKDGKCIDQQVEQVRVLFDSGTTISPMLDVVGREAKGGEEVWNDRVQLVTNNIKGIENVLSYRRGEGRYANLSIENFYVLPGKILAPYEAIADPDTLSAVAKFGFKSDGVYTILVTTGNYVLLSGHRFLPIARAGYHPDFKAMAYEMADEVYVVAPLGKVLTWAEQDGDIPHPESLHAMLGQFNQDLGLREMPRDETSEAKSYQLVYSAHAGGAVGTEGKPANVDAGVEKSHVDEWLRKTTLVTTTRPQGCLFSIHAQKVSARFDAKRNYRSDWNTKQGPFISHDEFNDLPWSMDGQEQMEIPHKSMRSNTHRNRYFWFNKST